MTMLDYSGVVEADMVPVLINVVTGFAHFGLVLEVWYSDSVAHKDTLFFFDSPYLACELTALMRVLCHVCLCYCCGREN
jgi:hypothetical protein